MRTIINGLAYLVQTAILKFKKAAKNMVFSLFRFARLERFDYGLYIHIVTAKEFNSNNNN